MFPTPPSYFKRLQSSSLDWDDRSSSQDQNTGRISIQSTTNFCAVSKTTNPTETSSTLQLEATGKQELDSNVAEKKIQAMATTTTTSSRSKPQACKVCHKILSSASSYYVHMKLHSGVKPFACLVKNINFLYIVLSPLFLNHHFI